MFDRVATFSADSYHDRARDLGALHWENAAKVRAQSPCSFAHRMDTPTLVTHVNNDYRVPDQNGLAYYNTLLVRGVPTRLAWFPDENHRILKPRNSRLWYKEFFDWLAMPAALRFFESLGSGPARQYRSHLVARATSLLAAAGARPVGADDLGCAMRSFVLPQRRAATTADVEALVSGLWQRHRIQAMAVEFGEALLLRVSAQVYVDEEDLEALAAAIGREGWPGR